MTDNINGEIEELADRIRKNALVTAKNLYKIWNRIGFSTQQINQRCKDIEKYQLEMLEAMEEEERENEQKILRNIERLCKEEFALCKELNEQLPSFEESEGLLCMESRHKAFVKELQKRKEEVMIEVRELIAEDENLSDRLGLDPFCIAKNVIPSHSEKVALKEHIQKLRHELQVRMENFKKMRGDLETLFEELEMAPRTSFEVEIFTTKVESATFSKNKMHCMKELHDELQSRLEKNKQHFSQLWQQISALWDRLNVDIEYRETFHRKNQSPVPSCISILRSELHRCEELKRQNMTLFVSKVRAELLACWEKCRVGKEERENFIPFYSDNFTDDLLTLLEMEVGKYQEFYETNCEIFSKVEKREALWNKMRDLEASSKDPGRLFGNRGCKLLQEEKERKRLQQELPRVEGEIVHLLNEYEKVNGKPLRIDSQDFRLVIEKQWTQYQEEKEMEKLKKLKEKQEKLEEERKGGAKPMTPLKRRFGNGTTLRAETASPAAKRKCPPKVGGPAAPLTRRNLQSTMRLDETVTTASSAANDTVGTTYSAFTAGLQHKAGKENCRSSATLPRRRSPRLVAACGTPSTPITRSRLAVPSPHRGTPTGKSSKMTLTRNLRPFLI